jgi:hypothetical protein
MIDAGAEQTTAKREETNPRAKGEETRNKSKSERKRIN